MEHSKTKISKQRLRDQKILNYLIGKKVKFKVKMISNSFPVIKTEGIIVKDNTIEIHIDKDYLERFMNKWQHD